MPILTLVTPNPQTDFDLWIKRSYPDIQINNRQILDERCVRWDIENELPKESLDIMRKEFRVDIFQTEKLSSIRLFMADMDSTIIAGESLDDMADMVGIGKKISAITERAMRGELDFEQALTERISLLKGMSVDVIEQALGAIKLNKGAVELLNHLKRKGVYCVLVSGGFTQFTSVVADKLGFDENFGNELLIEDDRLTGEVKRPILDKNFKLEKLLYLQNRMVIEPNQIIAVGDGANDLPMLSAAGIGVSYFGKPLLRDRLINRVEYTDLSSLIYTIE